MEKKIFLFILKNSKRTLITLLVTNTRVRRVHKWYNVIFEIHFARKVSYILQLVFFGGIFSICIKMQFISDFFHVTTTSLPCEMFTVSTLFLPFSDSPEDLHDNKLLTFSNGIKFSVHFSCSIFHFFCLK
jgi:hypothetical protein